MSSVPAGSARNASSVGANTVKGPLPWSVSTRPAAVAAVRRVLNDPAAVGVPTMSLAAAADGEALGVATGAGVAEGDGVAAVEVHAASARTRAGNTRAMVRFLPGTPYLPRARCFVSGLSVVMYIDLLPVCTT